MWYTNPVQYSTRTASHGVSTNGSSQPKAVLVRKFSFLTSPASSTPRYGTVASSPMPMPMPIIGADFFSSVETGPIRSNSVWRKPTPPGGVSISGG